MIGVLLIAGGLLSAVIVLTGGICFLIQHGGELHTLPNASASGLHGHIAAGYDAGCGFVIQIGLLILVATPVARVAVSIAAFLMARDWTYVLLTSIVFVVLIYGLGVAR
jgi:uncharacterized membrane protein